MKKLEDIPKKNVFKTPDGYFDELPLKIQAGLAKKYVTETGFVFKYKLHYTLPIVAIFIVGIIWFTGSRQSSDVNTLLAAVQTDELIAYVNETDLTNFDLLENVAVSGIDIEEIESEVYGLDVDAQSFDEILEYMDLDTL